MRKLTLAAAAVAMTLPTMLPAPAFAGSRDGYYNGRTWRGDDGRLRCRRKNGTTGLIIGGAAGALAGRAIDGGQNRTLGTIAGAAVGALAGRELDKSRGLKCR